MLSGLGVLEIHRFDWLTVVLERGALRGESIRLGPGDISMILTNERQVIGGLLYRGFQLRITDASSFRLFRLTVANVSVPNVSPLFSQRVMRPH